MRTALVAAALGGLALLSPAPAQDPEAWRLRSGQGQRLSQSPKDGFQRAFAALALAESGALSQAQQLVQPYLEWLSDYPQIKEVHGQREPAWIRGEAEQVALVTLALIELDRTAPDPRRREQIRQFAQGLAQLHHPNTQSYPFGAHVSFSGGGDAYAPLLDRNGSPLGKASGALWRAERSYQVKALATASAYLADKSLLEEAQSEALAIWSHLTTSNQWPWGFLPRPTGESNIMGCVAAVDNFLSLATITNGPVYSLLAGLSGKTCLEQQPANESEKAAQEFARKRLKEARIPLWEGYQELAPPVTYQVMEAENGRAVNKAFDEFEVDYPNGHKGKLVRVGRDQMFWMRFDIEQEGDYFFYLIFLKSQLEGGLVSVLMRIDGDKIIQVPLGGASDPYVDMDFVDGPRRLRSGPHSFGIRFNGLLMTQPAMLDSVIAWPVVERRYLGKPDGSRLLVLHNNSSKAARTTYPEIAHWPPEKVNVVDGSGQTASLQRESDRRRRKEYIVLPPGGTAWLEWRE